MTDNHQTALRDYIYQHTTKILVCLAVVLSVLVLCLFLFATLMTISWINLNTASYHTTVTIGAANKVTSIDCYPQNIVDYIEITESTQDTNMNVYKIEQSKLSSTITDVVLPEKLVGQYTATFNNTIHVNYYGNDNPLHVASNGYIMLNISIEITKLHMCAVKLLLFDSYVEYMKLFTDDEFKPPVNETCLNMTETKQNFTVNFPLPTQGSYYIGGMVVAGVTMNISGNGTITSYNASQLHIQDGCVSVRNCEVSITTKSIPNSSDNTCVLVDSDTANTNVTINVNKVDVNVDSLSYTILTIFFSFCLSIVIIVTIVLLYFYKKYKNRNNQPIELNYSEPIDLSDQSATLLEHDNNRPDYQSTEKDRNNQPIEPKYSKPIEQSTPLAHDDNKRPDDQATDTTTLSNTYEKSDRQVEDKEPFDTMSHLVAERRLILGSIEEPGNNNKETSTNTSSDRTN